MMRPSCSSPLSVRKTSLSLQCDGGEGRGKVDACYCKVALIGGKKKCTTRHTQKQEPGKSVQIPSLSKVVDYITVSMWLALKQCVHMCLYLHQDALLSLSSCVCTWPIQVWVEWCLPLNCPHILTLGQPGTPPPQWGQPHMLSGQRHPNQAERRGASQTRVPPSP